MLGEERSEPRVVRILDGAVRGVGVSLASIKTFRLVLQVSSDAETLPAHGTNSHLKL